MTKRFSRVLALLLAALMLLALASCSREQDEPVGPDNPEPTPDEPVPDETLPDPDPEPVPDPQPEPEPEPQDEITGENTTIAEGIWKIDTSYFVKNDMTVDSAYVAGDDRVLLFVSALNPDGTVSESTSVYFFSLTTGDFVQEWLDIGVVGVYPDRVYDDGTVSVVTLDSESYEYREILFIDPQSMTVESIPAPDSTDIVSLSISPDKRYVALTTLQDLRVTSLDFSTTYLSIPYETTDDGQQLVPSPTDWSADSRFLSYKMAAWESIVYPAIANIETGEIQTLDTLSGNEVRFVGNELFYSSWFPYLPCGFCSLDGSNAVETPLSSIVPDPTQLCQFSLSPDGAHLAIALQSADGGQAMVLDARTGEVLSSLSVPGQSFNEATFTPDGRTAVFSTASTLDQPKQVYVLDFGW